MACVARYIEIAAGSKSRGRARVRSRRLLPRLSEGVAASYLYSADQLKVQRALIAAHPKLPSDCPVAVGYGNWLINDSRRSITYRPN
jgi:hypothetical protein